MRIPKKEVRINGFQFRRLFIRDALETEFRGSCNIRLFGRNCCSRRLFSHDANARGSLFVDGSFLRRIRGLVCSGCLSRLAKSQTFERLPVLFRNCGGHEGESPRLAPSGRAVSAEVSYGKIAMRKRPLRLQSPTTTPHLFPTVAVPTILEWAGCTEWNRKKPTFGSFLHTPTVTL